MRFATGFLLGIVLSGCAGGGGAPAPRTYDLGTAAPASALAAVRVVAVRAAAPFDGAEMHYRLAWRNPAEIAAFAHSRWAAPPAELLRRHLLRASADGPAKCALEVEIHEFTQVFASREASDARVELWARLSGAAAAQRNFRIAEPGAGAEAATGALAFARAGESALREIAGWVAAQPGCR